jgi:hypothetical protein
MMTKRPAVAWFGGARKLIFNCLSCHAKGTIFEAAHFLEGKPLCGHGFLVDTIPYLAKMFGVECPTVELSEDEIYELNTYQAYQHAAYILRGRVFGARND